MIIRNDNGSQFSAHRVRQTLIEMEARQVFTKFTHAATPEENAYTEAFHSIVQRELMGPFVFSGLYDAKQNIEKCMYGYNGKRRHGALNGLTAMQKRDSGQALVTNSFEKIVWKMGG